MQLIQRLRDVDPNMGAVLHWLDQRLAEQGTTADEIVRAEHQEQTAMNVTVRNIIPSMRLMTDFDWHEFVEDVSLPDQILRSDTNFAEMDFATRDSYRHAIEDLSRGSRHSEIEVAEHVVHRIKRARAESSGNGQPREDRRADPGYYLISSGRQAFEHELGFRVPWKSRLLRLYMRSAAASYLGTIALGTALIVALPLLHERKAGVADLGFGFARTPGCRACFRPGHRTRQPTRDGLARPANAASPGVAGRRDASNCEPSSSCLPCLPPSMT